MITLVVHGANGRMGSRICALAEHDDRFDRIVPAIRAATRNTAPAYPRADVVVDFSSDEGTRDATRLAGELQAALLVGTTGLSAQTLDGMGLFARSLPLLVAPNTALGVAVLRQLVTEAARLLPGWDVDVVEQHHHGKRDAPSGTALALVRSLHDVGVDLDRGRVHSLRAGGIVGEHVVQLASAGEMIRLEHRALSRDVFAAGALDAAAWLVGRPPGRYDIEQVLEERISGPRQPSRSGTGPTTPSR